MWGRGSKGRLSAGELSAIGITSSFEVTRGTAEEGQKEGISRVLPLLTWIKCSVSSCDC